MCRCLGALVGRGKLARLRGFSRGDPLDASRALEGWLSRLAPDRRRSPAGRAPGTSPYLAPSGRCLSGAVRSGSGARRLGPFVRQATDVRETFERRQCPVSTTSESTSTFAPSTIPATSLEKKPPFRPKVVTDLSSAGLNFAQVEGLVLKFLLNLGVASGRRIADELGLPFGTFPDFLRQLKNQQIVAYTNSAAANDFIYSLTDAGRAGPRSTSRNAPTSARPPSRSPTTWRPSPRRRSPPSTPRMADLRRAFSDLLVSEEMFQTARPGDQLGPRHVPLRLPRQRQDEHRRADHALLRLDDLDSSGHRRRGADPQALRPGQPRSGRPRRVGPAPRRRPRPPLDRDHAGRRSSPAAN